MKIAHIRGSDGSFQPLKGHCVNVGTLCTRAGTPLALGETAGLIGLMHDMGKATQAFSEYLQKAVLHGASVPSPHYHAPTGAIYAYRRWFLTARSSLDRLCAQIIALCILGHHAGLCDCTNAPNDHGESDFIYMMEKQAEAIHYDEATQWYFLNVISQEELDARFRAACLEISARFNEAIFKMRPKQFALSMLTRTLLSMLIDADRWDSACFEYGASSITAEDAAPDWQRLCALYEDFHARELDGRGKINSVRAEISAQCMSRASDAPGVFTLSVPTGGGKTYSSLRFALHHSARNANMRRIFYIIPFNTILDQNAKDIRHALNDYPSILEHHSNVVMPSEDEQQAYKRLTERWDSDIILTSMVQFLNACFSAANSDARRLYRLVNSILIFDEIQALPKHCQTLFERAIDYLSVCCNCTVLLCTATQPHLELFKSPVELVSSPTALYSQLKRVQYRAQIDAPLDSGEAAARLAELISRRSVLCIVNTKAVAWDIFSRTKNILLERGLSSARIDFSFDDEHIRLRARERRENEILFVHMSTLLCPAHRSALLRWVKIWLSEGARVLCVSTALIEAGINVSFPIVVRSLAALSSIVQAAGRANRSMEYGMGDVYIWELAEENLRHLPDISHGRDISRGLLSSEGYPAPDSPEMIACYFEREQEYIRHIKDYPLKNDRLPNTTIVQLLSGTASCAAAARDRKSTKELILRQSFRTAYQAFRVIEQETLSVLVPFGEGKALIAALCGTLSMEEEVALLRMAQLYSVGIYDGLLRRLNSEGAIVQIGNTGILALKDGFYDELGGIQGTQKELEAMIL